MSTIPIGDPRPAGTEGPAGDQRAAGEEGPAGDPRPAGETAPTSSGSDFDPAEHTVDEVKQHLADNPDDEDRVLEAERNGKNRASLTG